MHMIFLGYNRYLLLVIDIFALLGAASVSFVLRFEGAIPVHHFLNLYAFSVLSLIVHILIFWRSRLYQWSLDYTSVRELYRLIQIVALATLIIILVLVLFRDVIWFAGFPRSVIFINSILVLFGIGFARIVKRLVREVREKHYPGARKVLIAGAGGAGAEIVRSMTSFKSMYVPIGFVDDDRQKQNIFIHGYKVLGTTKDIPILASTLGIQELVIAMPSCGSNVIRKIVMVGKEAGIKKISIVPSFSQILQREVTIQNLKEVEPEDLLGRDPIQLDEAIIRKFLTGKIILVTGAAGSIGSELSRQILRCEPTSLILLDQDETGLFSIHEELKRVFPAATILPCIADICDERKIQRTFQAFKPHIVFHAAAYKHVPLMEFHADEAVKNNIFGTLSVAQAARQVHTDNFVFISTDKAIHPTSVMGATKRMGEMVCQYLSNLGPTKFVSVRFGNVLGSRGSVIPIFKEQIKSGGPVEVTHPDMIRYFMTTAEACLLVMQAGAIGKGGEVFVLDMGEPVRIVDLAKDLIRLSGLEPYRDIPIVFTEPRPGEKLFEEILTREESESYSTTQNEHIRIAKISQEYTLHFLERLEELKLAAIQGDEQKIKSFLRSFTT